MADTENPAAVKPASTAKEVAQSAPSQTPTLPAAAASAPANKAVKAVNRINGTIEPGTIFVPDSAQDLADLEALGAVVDLNEAETALWEKMQAAENPLG